MTRIAFTSAALPPTDDPDAVRVRLTPASDAGQAELEAYIVHLEALGHGVIPWDRLPPSERRRLRRLVARIRRRLRAGGRVRIRYGAAPAWTRTPVSTTPRPRPRSVRRSTTRAAQANAPPSRSRSRSRSAGGEVAP